MATKNKALPYILFGVPIAIGIYFIVKSIQGKAKPKQLEQKPEEKAKQSEQKPEEKAKDEIKKIVDKVKKVVYPIIKKDNFPLKRGSYGDNVKTLQTALMQYNPSLPSNFNDSDFGKNTEDELLTLGSKIVDNQNILNAIVSGGQSKENYRKQSKIDAELKLNNQRLFNQF